jgi:hypothetical protein
MIPIVRVLSLAVLVCTICGSGALTKVNQESYDDPALVDAQFSFDDSVWERSPRSAGNGIVLRLRGSVPAGYPAAASCQIGFFVKTDPPQFTNASDYLRKVDTAFDLRMKGAMLAVPEFGRSKLQSSYQPCAARGDALCARFLIVSRLHAEPGIGLTFVLVKDGHRIDGDCTFFDDSRSQATQRFDEIVKGAVWDSP